MWIRFKNKTIDVTVYISFKLLAVLILDCNYSDTLKTFIKSLFTGFW